MNKFPNFDFASYFKGLNIDAKVMNNVGDDNHTEVAINCPMCIERGEPTPDNNQKLWINVNLGAYHCYRCKWEGTYLPFLVAKFSKTTPIGAIKILKGKIEDLELLNYQLSEKLMIKDIDFFENENDNVREIEFPHGFEPFRKEESSSYHRYLTKRGIPLSYAIEAGWGYSRVGYYAGRIIVPFYYNERLVYWQARDIRGEKHPQWGTKDYRKVRNPKGISAKKILYNYDIARDYSEIVIVEGFMDAAKVGRNAVALNGKTIHAEQLELLAKTKAKKAVLMLDPDTFIDQVYYRGGKNKGKLKKPSSIDRAKSALGTVFEKIRVIRLPDGRDAGSYNSEEIKRIVLSH